MNMDKITAPWTSDQIDALNRFQRAGFVHPFTCSGHEGEGDRTLIATRKGWICAHCDYTQTWAWAGMLQEAALEHPAVEPTWENRTIDAEFARQTEIFQLRGALAESLKLQSHYASLLNDYDGGKRMQFADSDAWMARLAELEARAKAPAS